jgi:Leucine-rich repeat (LRR) protein
LLITVSSFLSLCFAADVEFDIEHSSWTAYLQVPENETIISPGMSIANPISEETINLIIEGNNGKMTFLPENIAEIFPNLINFWVLNCSMKAVAKTNFNSLNQLILLTISMNENLETIQEESFGDLVDLRDLYLQSNSISNIRSKTFAKLTKLEILDLSANQLTSLPADVFKHNVNLEYLAINENKLMTIASGTFDSLKSLQKIWLNHNEITHLSNNTFTNVESLRELHLDGNEISRVDNNLLANLLKLERVSLAGNMLIAVDFGMIETNEELIELSIAENQIVIIENAFVTKQLANLRIINLSDNLCINQVFYGTSGEIVHKKMYQFKIEETCAVRDLNSSANMSTTTASP